MHVLDENSSYYPSFLLLQIHITPSPSYLCINLLLSLFRKNLKKTFVLLGSKQFRRLRKSLKLIWWQAPQCQDSLSMRIAEDTQEAELPRRLGSVVLPPCLSGSSSISIFLESSPMLSDVSAFKLSFLLTHIPFNSTLTNSTLACPWLPIWGV